MKKPEFEGKKKKTKLPSTQTATGRGQAEFFPSTTTRKKKSARTSSTSLCFSLHFVLSRSDALSFPPSSGSDRK